MKKLLKHSFDNKIFNFDELMDANLRVVNNTNDEAKYSLG